MIERIQAGVKEIRREALLSLKKIAGIEALVKQDFSHRRPLQQTTGRNSGGSNSADARMVKFEADSLGLHHGPLRTS